MANRVIPTEKDSAGSVGDRITLKIDSKNSKGCKFWKFLRKNLAVLTVCALTLVIILLVVTIILKFNHVPRTLSAVPEGQKQNLTSHDDQLKLVSRLEWLAVPPVEPASPLATPVSYVIIHHTATENCSSQAQCVFHVRYIQTFHMESRSWWDIGYNFLVGGDGAAYEGRGWMGEGAHTHGYNAKSIGIAFIGTFNRFKPPQRQIKACKQLIAKGVELGYIRDDYKLLAARQLQKTGSPGQVLYEDMKTWRHWSFGP